jgi:Ser/Thr protein kinase RdoA (MazF antagonist)
MDNFFYQLTPEVVLQAIEAGGLSPTGHCLALNSYENRVYDLKLDDGSHVVSKFYRPGRWNEEQILEEHAFLLQLRDDEIPVCAPLHFDDGSTLQKTQGIHYAIWPRTGGRAADELTDEKIQVMGRLLARIHNIGAAREIAHRPALTGETYGLAPLAFLKENGFLPSHLVQRYSDAVHEIVTIFDALSAEVPFHRIHGDCHFGNLLNGSEGLYVLDFDDFLNGPAVQDVWMLVPARDREGLRQRDLFLDAYRTFREFDPAWLRLIEPLRSLRYIRYAGWIARRWDDPAFPPAFPHFGTESYWEEETDDLEDQVEFIHKHRDDLPNHLHRPEVEKDETEGLTNKDYFYDLDD